MFGHPVYSECLKTDVRPASFPPHGLVFNMVAMLNDMPKRWILKPHTSCLKLHCFVL
jgi:hypothetical protein